MIKWDRLNEMAADATLPDDVRRISGALSAAMNDWPALSMDSLESFVSTLKEEIGILSRENIHRSMKRSTEVWKGEAFSELLSAWKRDENGIPLDELIQRVTQLA